MRTNRILIVANELIESTDGRICNISHQAIFRAYRESEKYSLSWDDIFIGNRANWKAIRERIEEYILLSHLREGKLELVYFSPYDQVEKIYNSSFKDHLQFYDTSISIDDLKNLGDEFSSSFGFHLLRLEDKVQLFHFENDSGQTEQPLHPKFYTKNVYPQLKIA